MILDDNYTFNIELTLDEIDTVEEALEVFKDISHYYVSWSDYNELSARVQIILNKINQIYK